MSAAVEGDGKGPQPQAAAQGDAPRPEASVQDDGKAPVSKAPARGDGPRPEAAAQSGGPRPETAAQSDGRGPEPRAPAKGQRLELLTSPMAIGAALFLLGVGAWCSRGRTRAGPAGHFPSAKFHSLDLQGSHSQPRVVGAVDAMEAEEGAGPTDSLEDILKKLEDGKETPVDFSAAAAGSEAGPERKASKKKQRKSNKRQQQEEAPAAASPDAEAPQAAAAAAADAPRAEAPPTEAPTVTREDTPELKEARATLQQLEEAAAQQPGRIGAEELQEAKDALRRMEEAGSESKEPEPDAGEEDDPRVHEIMEEALKKLARAQVSKSGKVNKRKVKEIISTAIKKLEGLAPSGARDDLKEKLLEMLASEEGEDDAPKSKKKGKAKKSKKEREEEEREKALHNDFANSVKQETAKKLDYSIADVKAEFKETYGQDAKSLLCSGCKLVAARMDSELGAHEVHDAENPAAMIQGKRKALDATCSSFRHLRVAPSETGLRFQASEADDLPGEHSPLRMEQKLCHALLEDSKFDLLAKMIQKKAAEQVPTMSLWKQPEPKKDNWERWLCLNRARMCKRSEVKDDDEDEEL